MAYRSSTDLRLKEEYCCKPENVKCPIHNTCYDNEFQCRYFKQVWINPAEEGFIIRQGNSWYRMYDNKAKGDN